MITRHTGCPAHFVAAAWTIDAFVLLELGRARRAQRGDSAARRRLLVPMLVVLGLAVAGEALLLDSRSRAAAWVACGPLVAGAVLYAGWFLMLLRAGRKSRWN